VADIYTEDAKLLGSHAPAIVGKKNIGMAIGSLIKAGITQVGLKTIEVWGTDEILTEEGELSLATRDGKQIEKGKYVVIWKKADGHWKILRDFSNSDLPLPSGK
jgi:ketosteroid isomerase-like protein